MRELTDEKMVEFEAYLRREEKSKATIDKYMRDISCFYVFLSDRILCKEETIAYKNRLIEEYAPASVNSMLVALNCFLRHIGSQECCVKLLKIQRQIFINEEKELTKQEFRRLVDAAENTRMSLLLQTICGTGIRVGELKYITVEAVHEGKAVVNCKNKTRVIFIPGLIQRLLMKYIKNYGIQSGPVFVTKNGEPLNRSNIWRDMKALCQRAGVSAQKVFPHNLRHLFARTFYSIEKDIVRLADLLGHSNINTTRIYTMETGYQHMNRLEKVQKILTT